MRSWREEQQAPLFVFVVVDRNLLRICDDGLESCRRCGLPREVGGLLPSRFFIDAFAGHVDLAKRFRLGEFERSTLLGFQCGEVAFRDGVDAVLDLEEGGERERLRVGVPRGCRASCR